VIFHHLLQPEPVPVEPPSVPGPEVPPSFAAPVLSGSGLALSPMVNPINPITAAIFTINTANLLIALPYVKFFSSLNSGLIYRKPPSALDVATAAVSP
jgi:hypothetical protein